MQYEFAIRCNDGTFWGLPTRTWDTYESALDTLKMLVDVRIRLRGEAIQARKEIHQMNRMLSVEIDRLVGGAQGFAARQRAFTETVQRWEKEKDREHCIVRREVGQWRQIAVSAEGEMVELPDA